MAAKPLAMSVRRRQYVRTSMRKRLTKPVVTRVRARRRAQKLKRALEDINARYAGVFKRLAE